MIRNIYKSFKITHSGKKKANTGFTLIELLLAASLMGIVITVSGWGLSAILLANARSEAESVISNNLARALDFISDDIKTANSASDTVTAPVTAPNWAWTASNLGGGSPVAKLYLQIPLTVESTTASNGTITITKHGFSDGNAVTLTGSGTPPTGLTKSTTASATVYYVTAATTDTFKLASSINGTAINFTGSITNGTLTANRLVIYYIRTSSTTWLDPNTVNRSVGPCSNPYEESNCPALVDGIADAGFAATVTNSRQVTLGLMGRLNKNNKSKSFTTLSTQAFVRNTPP